MPLLVLFEVVKKVRRERGEAAALEAAAVLRSGRIVEVDIATVPTPRARPRAAPHLTLAVAG